MTCLSPWWNAMQLVWWKWAAREIRRDHPDAGLIAIRVAQLEEVCKA